jgi:hypothetical protein
VDGIRLDEYGHGGYICTSRKHPHIFQNDGENIWMQAVIHGVKEIRKETDKFNKDALLLAEYFGTDAGAQVFDGALSYDVCRGTSDLRPLAVNLFRFYFPECKLFELDEKNTNTRRDIWLFNAVGVYNSSLYPAEYHNILKKYNAAFNGNIEPLIDTLIPYLYANRFAAVDGSEVVYTVFNQTGHTVEGALLEVDGSGSYRYIDAFSGKELSVEKQANGKFAVVGKVSPEKVIVIAAVKR